VPEELCGVRDLASRLGQRLAHFQGHQQSQVVDAFVQQREGARKHVGACLRRQGREISLGRDRGLERSHPVGRAGVRDLAEHLTRRRIEHIEGGRSLRVDPLPADAELFRNSGQDRCFMPFLAHRCSPMVIAWLTPATGPIR
jgi:hypothetical protein